MSSRYVPAWSFASAAARWCDNTEGKQLGEVVGEPAQLAVFFSALSCEALIAEFLNEATYISTDDLFGPRVSTLQRWTDGTNRLATASTSSVAAAKSIQGACQERGCYGLLVRTRNKLIHPRVHTELFDDAGHSIPDGSVERLVQDLRAPPARLPTVQPAFPSMIYTRAAARWALSVCLDMATLLHAVVEREFPEHWRTLVTKR